MRDSRSVIHGTVGQLYMEEQVSYIWIIGSVMYGIKDQFYKGQQVSYIYSMSAGYWEQARYTRSRRSVIHERTIPLSI